MIDEPDVEPEAGGLTEGVAEISGAMDADGVGVASLRGVTVARGVMVTLSFAFGAAVAVAVAAGV
jgi:hypothetical protein